MSTLARLMMLFSLLFALALAHITAHRPRRRRAVLAAVGLALLFELSPFPRPLYSAHSSGKSSKRPMFRTKAS